MYHLRLGDREDLERLILKKLAELKQLNQKEECYVSDEMIANQLETSEDGVVNAWVLDFSGRCSLLSTPYMDGIIFTPLAGQ